MKGIRGSWYEAQRQDKGRRAQYALCVECHGKSRDLAEWIASLKDSTPRLVRRFGALLEPDSDWLSRQRVMVVLFLSPSLTAKSATRDTQVILANFRPFWEQHSITLQASDLIEVDSTQA